MDVGGPQLHRLLDHHVDQPHDRGGVLIHDIACRRVGIFGFREIDGRIGELLEHGVGAFAFYLPVVPVDGFQDGFARCQGRLDLAVQNKTQFFDGFNVKRVAHGHLERILLFGQREGRVFAGDRLRHQLNHVLRNLQLRQVDEFHVVELGHRPHDFFTRGVAEFHEAVGHICVLLPRHLLSFVELIATDDPPADQDLPEIIL